jgi:hypothetical protein
VPAAFSISTANKEKNMGLYDVLLGIDHAARDTRRRLTVRVMAEDRLSAAIAAEEIGNNHVREKGVQYTHAMSVRRVNPRPAAVMPLPLTA